MKLNQTSPLPLYRQLAELLEDQIVQGRIGPGEKIPSEPALARQFRIGRPTARQAVDLLCSKGLVARRRGAGTFVKSNPRAAVDFFTLGGTTAAFAERGIELRSEILVPPRTTIFQEQEWYYLRLRRLAGQEPVLLESFYLLTALFPYFEKHDLGSGSISTVVRKQYLIEPSHGRQRFRAYLPDQEEQALLSIDSTVPVLDIHRYLAFGETEMGIINRILCRTDKYDFVQHIR